MYRSNLPTGTITSTTLASTAIGGADESAFQQTTTIPSLLLVGTNVFAVQMHQSGGTSSDISFALELTAGTGVTLTRAPYLQMGTPTSTVVRQTRWDRSSRTQRS